MTMLTAKERAQMARYRQVRADEEQYAQRLQRRVWLLRWVVLPVLVVGVAVIGIIAIASAVVSALPAGG